MEARKVLKVLKKLRQHRATLFDDPLLLVAFINVRMHTWVLYTYWIVREATNTHLDMALSLCLHMVNVRPHQSHPHPNDGHKLKCVGQVKLIFQTTGVSQCFQ